MVIPNKKVNLHKSDIKDIYLDNDTLITCSRDKAITFITQDKIKKKEFNYGYLNTIEYSYPIIYIGSQSGNLILYDIEKEEEKVFKVHNDNISALKLKNDFLLTGSWDNSLSLFKKMDLIYSDKTEGSVLCFSFYKEGFICGLETGRINFYQNFNKVCLTHFLNLHIHPIRDLLVIDNKIKSISQSVIISDEKRPLEYFDCDNLMFKTTGKMTVGDNGLILFDNQYLQIEVGSIWTIKETEDSYFLGCSDGSIYIFNKFSSEHKILSNSLLNFYTFETKCPNKEKQNFTEALNEDYKIEGGIIYQKIEGQFVSLGRIKYDSSFTIEIENKTVNVEFNQNECPYAVAERVIKEKKIDSIYKEEIANFINNNFKKNKKFKYLTSIPKEKVMNLIKDYKNKEIINLLNNKEIEINELESEINALLKEKKFIALDLVRYAYSLGHKLNINFLFKVTVDDKKEAIAYIRLLTNLYGNINMNLDVFRNEVRMIIDKGWVSQDIIDDYEFNRSASLNK